MPKRRKQEKGYVKPTEIPVRLDPPDLSLLAPLVPQIVNSLADSIIKKAQGAPDWSLYRINSIRGNPLITREMCDRCGKVWVPPAWRKIRKVNTEEVGTVYVETGLCKDCINAATYVDYYLDAEPLTFAESQKLFYEYAVEYERNWRLVLAAAPKVILTEEEWQRACIFFNGCAFCGNRIEVRAMYFPALLNGSHVPWNVIPLCSECMKIHYRGRQNSKKTVKRYKVFSTLQAFNKQKTTRVYLLQQMREHGIYMDPLLPFMKRFRETLILEGSMSDEWLASHEQKKT